MTEHAQRFKRTKFACYYTYLGSSAVFGLPPLLFLTFQSLYGISDTLCGTLVLVNFCTQLMIDLLFSFFSKHFNIHLSVRVMPLLTSFGMLVYALVPTFFPQYAFWGLLGGTIIFSVAAGLGEVLLSPLIAAIPSEHPDRDMSLLHSLYAYGLLTVITLSTIFLRVFGVENWMYLTLFWAILPIGSFVLFSISPLPDMALSQPAASSSAARKRTFALALCVCCIFLGAAAENVMTNWISSYVEVALQFPKILGDILGMAVFAVLLGLVRTWYAKRGKNIENVLLVGMIGAFVCYLIAAFCPIAIVALVACVCMGIFTSMLWPGTLILMEEKIAGVGVAAYALMAAGGDFGSSLAPQAVGVIIDKVEISRWAIELAQALAISPEQIGRRVGMLAAAIPPLLGVALLIFMRRYFRRHSGELS